MKKRVAVFCSSSNHLEQGYYTIAAELGTAIAKGNYDLIYGGTDVGMMKATADAAKANGSHIIGVVPKVIEEMGVANTDCDTLHRTENMSARKALIADLADAFVALPGGFGTLEEFSEILTAKHLGVHNKAIVLLNWNGFYDHLITWFDHLYAEKFANSSYKNSFHIASSAEDAINYLKSYKASAPKNKY